MNGREVIDSRVCKLSRLRIITELRNATTESGLEPQEGTKQTLSHMYEWLAGYLVIGDADQRNDNCPDTYESSDGCKVCAIIQKYANPFELSSTSDPIGQLPSLVEKIDDLAYTALKEGLNEPSTEIVLACNVLTAVRAYLTEVTRRLNIAIFFKELELAGCQEVDVRGEDFISYSSVSEDGTISFLDTEGQEVMSVDSKNIEIKQNVTEVKKESLTTKNTCPLTSSDVEELEWKNVTPIMKVRASEMMNMDMDSLLDLYNYYTQLNSVYKDGSLDQKLGLIKAVFNDRTK